MAEEDSKQSSTHTLSNTETLTCQCFQLQTQQRHFCKVQWPPRQVCTTQRAYI